MPDTRHVKIFDTTLRDGEQSPGASMNLDEKLKIAHALVDLGVDIIEAGFPIASPGDFEAVREVSAAVHGATVCGLARCNDKDIDRAWEALKGARRARIHVFLATSAIHREFKLKCLATRSFNGPWTASSGQSVIATISSSRPKTRLVPKRIFSARWSRRRSRRVPRPSIFPTRSAMPRPQQMGKVIVQLRDRVSRTSIEASSASTATTTWGWPSANSLSAVENGAGQIECTINGIGERAGNCSLEEVVMAMRTRQDYYHCDTGINTQRLVPTSRLVSGITGIQVQRNKAIVGRNAFAHEAGIHQDGMLKERTTYEIMRPEDVGFTKTELVLGKHSGRAALADRCRAMGFHLSGEQLQSVFERFKRLADKKKEIYDGDIAALIKQEIHQQPDAEWSLVSFQVTSGTGSTPRVCLTLQRGEQQFTEQLSAGDGPVDAAFLATEKITGLKLVCKDFLVRSATLGRDAVGEVTVEVEHQGKTFRGRGFSTDTVEATVRAILNAVNLIAAG